ncbi:MAG: undecaprenyldiphospho-muramoylpentapeptide beta-N-acetylglucosaminyltransferase [Oscillospiraceae bacterium]|jgi:UDP-N-acetylglucosamine--N-acetylmuramyl-(pentapeptide) pyrophosphoryl-undecaprenol N-acetylglucosamine transferase|nr:undecaprenyldiphospho-muramoylpentapeptide beta-N-acetylglucosaminyltransferase [Oscillospiraceae bacterium]
MKVLIAAGGTGGHINPGLSIAGIVQKRIPNSEILFVGNPAGMEAQLIPEAGYGIEFLKISGIQRKPTPKNLIRNIKALSQLAVSGKRAKEILNKFKPDIAIGTGGYVSGPIIRKAAQMGIPTAIHEANAYPGVTTKLLSKEVGTVMLTTDAAVKHLGKDVRYAITGLPVRSALSVISRQEARRALGFNGGMCILSFGGSLGAGCINEVMADVIKWHTGKGLNINHIHGYGGMGKHSFPEAMAQAKIPLTSDTRRITEYINDIDKCLAAADLVICRAGASTLAELQAVGRASVLIPSPIATGNHQFHNATVLENAGAAIVMEQSGVTSEKMIKQIEEFYKNPQKLVEMGKNAKALAITDTDDRIFEVIRKLTA